MLQNNCAEKFAKLRREFHCLMRSFSVDGLDNYIHTADSLVSWMRQDNSLNDEQKMALERFTVPESMDWQMCKQISNQQKHFGRERNLHPLAPRVNWFEKTGNSRGFIMPPSSRVYGAGDEVTIECEGRRESGLAFVIRSFRHFHFIFEVAPVPVGQRVVRGCKTFCARRIHASFDLMLASSAFSAISIFAQSWASMW